MTAPANSDSDKPPPSGHGRAADIIERLTRVQLERPGRLLLVALVSLAVALLLASKLPLKTAFGELLPQNKESVIIKEQTQKRLTSSSSLIVVIDGEDTAKLERFVDELSKELRKLDPEQVSIVDSGAGETRQFFADNRALFLDQKTVDEIHDQVQERYDYEVSKAAGFLLDEDDDDDAPEPITEESIKKRFEPKSKSAEKVKERFPDYYMDEEKLSAAVLVKTPISSGDLERSNALKKSVLDAVARTEASVGKMKRVGLTGTLITSAEMHQQIKDDLAHVGFWGALMILGVVLLFYLRLRTLLLMVLTVSIGAGWTFGMAYLLVGHLNSSTGFLFSIVVGNGINFGIIYMARYLEARRTDDVSDSLRVAHRDTWLATLTAAAAASCAYGSLAVTDFRGFKHFGVIGGSGMLLCWLATYLFLPSLLVVSEKLSPIKPPSGIRAKVAGFYGKPFAFIAGRFPLAITVGGLLLIASATYLARGFIADPMEYNMSRIANDTKTVRESDARVLARKADKLIGPRGQSGLALATERLDQVLPLKKTLEALRDNAPKSKKPFGQVITLYSFLPTEQAPKIEKINETVSLLKRAHSKGWVKDDEWKKINEYLPNKELKELELADLPDRVAAPFTEKDGTRGRLVFITPTPGRSIWDGRYLIEFADSFRRTKLPDGSVVKGSGAQVIYADVIIAVAEDAPKAIVASVVSTLLIVVIAFRRKRYAVAVIVSVSVGLLWTVAILAVWRTEWATFGSADFHLEPLRLNFLNFVALPITVGVGADYAVNVMERYRVNAGKDMRRVIVETGGAVVLCSMTTTLGYFALTLSVNRAIRSFGYAAAVGELCCLFAGVLLLPAFLIWRSKRAAAAAG